MSSLTIFFTENFTGQSHECIDQEWTITENKENLWCIPWMTVYTKIFGTSVFFQNMTQTQIINLLH